jgi:hypothetical protein
LPAVSKWSDFDDCHVKALRFTDQLRSDRAGYTAFFRQIDPLTSILSEERELPIRGKRRVKALKQFPASRGSQSHNGRAKGAAK